MKVKKRALRLLCRNRIQDIVRIAKKNKIYLSYVVIYVLGSSDRYNITELFLLLATAEASNCHSLAGKWLHSTSLAISSDKSSNMLLGKLQHLRQHHAPYYCVQ